MKRRSRWPATCTRGRPASWRWRRPQFSSAVQLSVGSGAAADAKSVLAVMQLGASSGQQVTVRAAGPDADKAVETLIAILRAVSKVGE